jgi:hypothetical protein
MGQPGRRDDQASPTKDKAMGQSEPLYPTDLTMLTAALDEYCRDFGIAKKGVEREEAGRLVMSLFQRGARTDRELKAALAAAALNRDPRLSNHR